MTEVLEFSMLPKLDKKPHHAVTLLSSEAALFDTGGTFYRTMYEAGHIVTGAFRKISDAQRVFAQRNPRYIGIVVVHDSLLGDSGPATGYKAALNIPKLLKPGMMNPVVFSTEQYPDTHTQQLLASEYSVVIHPQDNQTTLQSLVSVLNAYTGCVCCI